MTKKELRTLEKEKYLDEKNIPILDEIYVIIEKRKHDSGYQMYSIFGTRYNRETKERDYAKCLIDYCDVINIAPTFVKNLYDDCYYNLISIDSNEMGVFRFFSTSSKIGFKITMLCSTVEFQIVERD